MSKPKLGEILRILWPTLPAPVPTGTLFGIKLKGTKLTSTGTNSTGTGTVTNFLCFYVIAILPSR